MKPDPLALVRVPVYLSIYYETYMKTVVALLVGLAAMVACAWAADAPRGSLLELHSCEVYAGGCVVSSEATLGGRCLLRAWKFAGGSFANTDFAGLEVALLQVASENLAAPHAGPGQAVVYLPESASAAQRDALAAWLRESQPGLKNVRLQTRVAPLRFEQDGAGTSFSAGKFAQVRTASLETCESGACGEALWYTPRAPTTAFTVVADRSSRIEEPLLGLKWGDAGKRNAFLARFGDGPNKALYVSAADLCGPAIAGNLD